MAKPMAKPTPPLRIAYIYTQSPIDPSPHELLSYLDVRVMQESPRAIEQGKPRHRFLFGAVTSLDSAVLETLLKIACPPPGVKECNEPNTEKIRCGFHVGTLLRSDLEVRISRSRASTALGAKVLKRCKDVGIQAAISGKTDDECSEIMLQESDYMIDFHEYRPDGSYGSECWFWNVARLGKPQDSMLTNEHYDKRRHDNSWGRIYRRYGGRGWRDYSGCRYGFMPWKCPNCGRNCKRGKCADPLRWSPDTNWVKRQEEDRKWQERERERQMNLFKPGNTKWRELTAEELSRSFWVYRNDKDRWHSIDTFSSE